MFISALKRQYWAYFLFVLSHRLTSLLTQGFTKPLALGIVVEVLMLFGVSFFLFCIGYPIIKLAKWCIGNLFGTPSSLHTWYDRTDTD